MSELKQNYYGSLCTEMYEILHEQAPQDELDFYLSYAEKGKKILEPLCGSGRFLIPFLERGFDISGMDLSEEMLGKLKRKAPNARVMQADIINFTVQEKVRLYFYPLRLNLLVYRHECMQRDFTEDERAACSRRKIRVRC